MKQKSLDVEFESEWKNAGSSNVEEFWNIENKGETLEGVYLGRSNGKHGEYFIIQRKADNLKVGTPTLDVLCSKFGNADKPNVPEGAYVKIEIGRASCRERV